MDLNRLITFKTLVETLSFTETSKKLHVTQSAVSQQMKLLQEDYGAKVVQKINNHLVLTPEGRAFYQEIKTELEKIEKTYKKQKETKKLVPIIRLAGAQTYLTNILIPRLEGKGYIYHVEFLSSTDSNETLLSGENDIIFVSSPLSERLVENKHVFKENLLLVGQTKLIEKLSKDSPIPIATLGNGSKILNDWNELNQTKRVFEVKAKFSHMQGLYSFIKHHQCMALLPDHIVQKDLKEGNLSPIHPRQKPIENNIYSSILKSQGAQEVWNFFDKIKKPTS